MLTAGEDILKLSSLEYEKLSDNLLSVSMTLPNGESRRLLLSVRCKEQKGFFPMKHSRSSLFLMELLISLLFFSLASAVCIRLFAKSHLISRDTINQNNAIVQAQNLAEIWLATEGNMKELKRLLEAESGYVAELLGAASASEDGLLHATVSVYENQGNVIYSLKLAHHVSERRGSHE